MPLGFPNLKRLQVFVTVKHWNSDEHKPNDVNYDETRAERFEMTRIVFRAATDCMESLHPGVNVTFHLCASHEFYFSEINGKFNDLLVGACSHIPTDGERDAAARRDGEERRCSSSGATGYPSVRQTHT